MKTLNFLKKDGLALLFLSLPTALTLFFWNQLPEQLTTHWNLAGNADDYQPKSVFLLTTLGTSLITYLILLVVPVIDPKPNAQRIRKPLRFIRLTVMAVLAIMMSSIVLKEVGYTIDMIFIGKVVSIFLFLVVGNLMAKFPPNYFAGIRTPWTLEYPEIWWQVHRFGAKLWVAGSLILLLFVFRLENFAYLILFSAITLVLTLVPVIHSYVLYRKMYQPKSADSD
ncbi:SdpI family protein [Tunicatimonas pelagia]|uniref:SdpI family protein n=1 Tax=Tunicatimonas pelagia TaxID=931531 RepID=UPI002664ED7C|nr:SdpI family protein [Tunicatimonas pelagia]WKN45572.1 SdpI family protein [Tunicatimonas pelagia]